MATMDMDMMRMDMMLVDTMRVEAMLAVDTEQEEVTTQGKLIIKENNAIIQNRTFAFI